MEIPIVAGILGLGYYYNKNKTDEVINKDEPKNIYDSKRSLKIRRDELKHAEKVWHEPNRIFPGPPKINPELLFNKVDYDDNKLPVEFNSYDKNDLYSDIKVKTHDNKPINFYNTNYPVAGGGHGISLTGEPIEPNNFRHNNMVPFFGGRVKQNVDDKANQTLLEHYTGNINNYQEKKELGAFFPAENNICNPYGSANISSFLQDRIIPSKIMNNVTPVERVRVGPGLNQGYTAQPSGGFQQANARDYVLPKTVDELRVKNNPKLTYMGRILSGSAISRPGKIGIIEKRKPPSFYINSPDRYLTTTGAVTGERQRPNIVLKDVNRRTTGKRRRFGIATHVTGNKDNVRPGFRQSRKIQYKTDGPRNFDATGKWSAVDCQEEREDVREAEAKFTLHDYGKSRTMLKDTERQVCPENKYKGPLKAGNKPEARNCQEARETRKRFTSKNDHMGNMTSEYTNTPIYNPNDIPRTTIKEQTVDNTREGTVAPQRPANPPTYDPNDIPRTTIKEQTIDNDHDGFMDMQKPANPPVYDPNDIPRTTIKEQTIDNDHDGFMNPQESKSYVCDPEDVARTTIKQTTIDNDRMGVAHGYNKSRCRDPKDIVRTTIKETTIAQDVVGPMYKNRNMGYDIAKNEIRNTVRQFTSDYKYSGIAGPGVHKKTQSYEQLYNSTVKSLRGTKARKPMGGGIKKFNSDVNMTTKRVGDLQNKYLNERGLAPTKVYNSIPQVAVCGKTKDRFQLRNLDRLDTSILDQLKDNPYSMRSLAAEC